MASAKALTNINSFVKDISERTDKPGKTSSDWFLPNRYSVDDDDVDIKIDKDNLWKKLMPQQKFIRDYMADHTPYRGIILYHGLGVGKSCASISAVELLLNNRQVYVFTPASLHKNYTEEIRKCVKKYSITTKHWKFISLNKLKKSNYADNLGLVDNIIIKKHNGFWYSINDKESNFKNLENDEKEEIMEQINNTIENKYNFIHYNGLSQKLIDKITKNNTINPFENNVVVIDEVHNFISPVSNKSKISMQLYELLYTALNIKIICLTGTPIINRPYELSLLINLVKGQNLIHIFKLTKIPENKELIKSIEMLKTHEYIDNVEYDAENNQFLIQLYPVGFKKSASSPKVKIDGNALSREDIINNIKEDLKNNGIVLAPLVKEKSLSVLPFSENDFNPIFIEGDTNMINKELFARKSLGAVS
jgi:hypothetical protein